MKVVTDNITTLEVDVIVNAANRTLLGGGGVDGAIHRAGGVSILNECKEIIKDIGECVPGNAVITNAGNLPCKKIIHTVGPIWYDGNRNEAYILEDCYENSYKLAISEGFRTIAFPNISTGVYSFPKQLAAEIALNVSWSYVNNFDEILFACFDEENYKIYKNYGI